MALSKSEVRASASRANGAKGGRPITPKCYHVSNFGAIGNSIPRDIDGYTYTSIAGWMGANSEVTPGWTRADYYEWAKDQAKASREAIAKAERAIAKWQQE